MLQKRRFEEFLNGVADDRALGVPKHEALPHLLLYRVQIELFTKHAVIPLLRLFQTVQVLVESGLLVECGSVDAL